MGGAVKSVTRAATGLATGGLSEAYRAGGPKAVGAIANPGMALAGASIYGLSKAGKLFSGSTTPSVPGYGGPAADPIHMLEQTGGAVLLANIASGADPDAALASYLGVPKDKLPQYISQLDEADKQAIGGIQTQLQQINTNTNLKNQAVQKLVNDYPNIMANAIQTYGAQADAAIKPMLDQAMNKIQANFASTGGLSSGASAAAAARAGTAAGYDRLNYATNLAQQQFNQQLSEATALQSFQQKMMGQAITSADQTRNQLLGGQIQGALQTQEGGYRASAAAASQKSALESALGGLGGTILGSYIGGPMGGAIGGAAGKALTSGGGQRLNSGPIVSPSTSLFNQQPGVMRYWGTGE